MIFGVGTDILEIERINKILNKQNGKFIDRIYGSNEISFIKNKKKDLQYFLGKRLFLTLRSPKYNRSNRYL